VIAKPVDGIHRPGRPNCADRQVGQLRELRGHQPRDKLIVDIDLPRMHLHYRPDLAPWFHS
jgi:hypothetical protein